MYYAVEGCCHGNLDLIFASIKAIEEKRNIKVDLLIICGDFQATRNVDDLDSMSVPHKYRRFGDFLDYYSGKKSAPILTLFIGGNHEASMHLWELFHGGWVAPNIYFLGYTGSVLFRGMRIVGISGIYKEKDYFLPLSPEKAYHDGMMRQVYHTRSTQIDHLLTFDAEDVDIVVSHDWPEGITQYGDLERLLKIKPYFKSDIEARKLGNPHFMRILKKLKPKNWFAAHLHCKFSALVKHSGGPDTHFLALGKPCQSGDFIQILETTAIKDDAPPSLCYDPYWIQHIANKWNFPCPADFPLHSFGVPRSKPHSREIPLNFTIDIPYGKIVSKTESQGRSFLQNNQFLKFLEGQAYASCISEFGLRINTSESSPKSSARTENAISDTADCLEVEIESEIEVHTCTCIIDCTCGCSDQ